jgi:iron complex transport system substrate-binding protein
MKIVSLLPSATEIAFALELGDQLIGVSCDCDYPTEARQKRVISTSALKLDAKASPADVDAEVRDRVSQSAPIYQLDRDLLRELAPDLILAQDLCRVCAVPSGHVTEALETIGVNADVISLDPHSLEEVIEGISQVAHVTGARKRGDELVAQLHARIRAVRSKTSELSPIPTLSLEWADPPFSGGHWIPGMVRLAGGRDVMGIERAPSRSCTWPEIAASAPEVIVFMPCGYGLEQAILQSHALENIPEFASTPAAKNGQVFAVDGSSYFSRPGPRLIDGLEILAWTLHPEVFPPSPGRVVRVSDKSGPSL